VASLFERYLPLAFLIGKYTSDQHIIKDFYQEIGCFDPSRGRSEDA